MIARPVRTPAVRRRPGAGRPPGRLSRPGRDARPASRPRLRSRPRPPAIRGAIEPAPEAPSRRAHRGRPVPGHADRRRGRHGHDPRRARADRHASRPPPPRSCSSSGWATGSSARSRTSPRTRPRPRRIPDVAKFGSVDVEKIVGLGTDLVIAGGNNFNPPEAIDQLRDLGIPVLVVFAPDVDTALADIELHRAGRRPPRGGRRRSPGPSRPTFDEVEAATEGMTPPRVFYELDASAGVSSAPRRTTSAPR